MRGNADRTREPLSRAERILVGMFAALLGSGAVGFAAISGQILGLQRQIGDLRSEMHEQNGDLRSEMHREIGALGREVGELAERMDRIETVLAHRPDPPGR